MRLMIPIPYNLPTNSYLSVPYDHNQTVVFKGMLDQTICTRKHFHPDSGEVFVAQPVIVGLPTLASDSRIWTPERWDRALANLEERRRLGSDI